MIRYALIMAAGRGQRLMPLTTDCPKSMIYIEGQSLISLSIRQMVEKVPHIAITVGYKAALLASHVIQEGASMVFNTDGHGNSWWIGHTPMQYIDEPVLVLTCDNIVNLDLHFIEEEYERLCQPSCMIIPVAPVPGIQGDFILGRDNKVVRLSREESSPRYCSGIQLLNPAKVSRLAGGFEDFYEVWTKLIGLGRLYYSSDYPHQWYSVNTVEQLRQITLKKNSYEASPARHLE